MLLRAVRIGVGHMELIVTRGIPGSGKTTYAKWWVDADPDVRVRVNRDDIRFMMFGRYWGVDEDLVSSVEWATVLNSLRAGKSVIVDATHLHSRSVDRWRSLSQRWSACLRIMDFEIDVEEAISRDASRDRSVGADVIRSMFAKRERLLSR